eukprot:m.6490 g.6490  ORF g.6490 m.6490 type:complete len:337 (-) comp3538_c0_seq1:67-1077(-)
MVTSYSPKMDNSKKVKGSNKKWKKSAGKNKKLDSVRQRGQKRKSKKSLPALPSKVSLKKIVSSNWEAIKSSIDNGDSNRKRRRVTASEDAPTANDVWFDVTEEDLDSTTKPLPVKQKQVPLEKSKKGTGVQVISEDAKKRLLVNGSFTGATKEVALDCEMVGTGAEGASSILARCSIVNRYGHVLYDSYVRPKEKVTDYRTWVSGIVPKNLSKQNAKDFETVQKEVSSILKGKILVGHALEHDFKVLLLDHPRKSIRDTAKFKPFRKYAGGRTPGLKKLCLVLLGLSIQTGEHSSVEDAQATMAIYRKHRTEWKAFLEKKRLGKKGNPQKKLNPAK